MTGIPFEGGKKKFEFGADGLSYPVWSGFRSTLPPSYSVVDVDSYSGDAVGPQRFHRLAFIQRGRNAG
ncbi:hypothetical protein Bca4012_098415 [Brassica carinata]